MDFDLEWHHEQLREVADRYLTKHFPHTRLRELEDEVPGGWARGAHSEMAELGWWELAAADEDLVGLVLLFEALGRRAVPGPHFGSAVVAARILRAAGMDDLVEAITSGQEVVALAIYEESAGYDAQSVQLRASGDAAVVLDGRKMFVPFADGVDSLLVLARSGGGEEDLTWYRVPADSPGVTRRPLQGIANEKLFQVDFAAVRLTGESVVGAEDGGWRLLEQVLPVANLAQAAELVGVAEAAFEMAVEYAKARTAFGRPIGAFQVIQHMCADMVADLDAARFLVYQAAGLIEAGRPNAPEVAMAKAFAATAARRVCKSAHQIYAGHGFVKENSLNFFYRRQKAIELAFGDVSEQLDRVAARLEV